MKKTQDDWISEVWTHEDYQNSKKKNFDLLDKYLKTPPKNILDIGCGLAWESRLFNEKYNSELWLLDGDADQGNKNKSNKSTDVNYHQSSDNFLLYYSFEKLQSELDKLGTKNYRLIDCNNIEIQEDTKFDLITSWVSCGFHYPVSTYSSLIKKHSHNNTIVVMDVRNRKGKLYLEEGIEVIDIIQTTSKFITAVLKINLNDE